MNTRNLPHPASHPACLRRQPWRGAPARLQSGMSLVELLIGLALGMVVVIIAITALFTSRGLSVSTTDTARLQQQADYVFRVIGQQVRQAGSLELDLGNMGTGISKPLAEVVFDPKNLYHRAGMVTGTGTDNAPVLNLSFQNVPEEIYKDDGSGNTHQGFQMLNCLATAPGGRNPSNPATVAQNNPAVSSAFKLDSSKKELVCEVNQAGGGTDKQAIARNVVGFNVKYLVQSKSGSQFKMQKVAASAVSKWEEVFGLEVCLDIISDERLPMLTQNYTDCFGASQSQGGRRHLVTRHTWQLRSQGVL